MSLKRRPGYRPRRQVHLSPSLAHQTAVAVIMTNIAPAVAAASVGLRDENRRRELYPPACCNRHHRPQVKVRATSAAHVRNESSVPVDAAVTLMRCEVVCP